ncbi:MAG: lamin tail domain-containing protein, partial [Cyclobacteriaceae bacterium]|nr:lamin tail domain-containing protein [Cyclobacteriaceae bacterium]
MSITISYAQDSNQVIISEFMAANESIFTDEDGDYSDWIELYNPTSSPINLDGWYISDNPDNLIKWIFPDVSIESYGYLLIFSSGKDKRYTELHTNFKLSSSGELIILTKQDGETIATELEFQYPPQYPDISYGFINGEMVYMDSPTPGLANVVGDFLTPPSFNVQHGFFDAPFLLEINSNMSGEIKYTLDGSEPEGAHSVDYVQPLLIDSTTVVRAVVRNGENVSAIATSSYIFAGQIKSQPRLPDGYPATWGLFSKIEGLAPADYEMDPEICNSQEDKELIKPSLLSIPTISLVTEKDNLFSSSIDPIKGGIYIHTDPPTGGYG